MRADTLIRNLPFLLWVAFGSVCVWAMVVRPEQETIPYHLGWIALAVAYCLSPWPFSWALAGIAGYTVASGLVLLTRAEEGIVAWQETSEIPLMAVLVALMVWNVRRRQLALLALDRVRAEERERTHRRDRVAGSVTHEIRTTLTIVCGHLELVAGERLPDQARADLEVARDELGRLGRASQRMLRMLLIEESRPTQSIDLDALLAQTMSRWRTVSPHRDWQLDAEAGWLVSEPMTLRAGLDTLIENSLRYTASGDCIRLVGRRAAGEVFVGVADSGPGFRPGMTAALNTLRDPEDLTSLRHRDAAGLGGTGLGLGIVGQVARTCGGRLQASSSTEGGALLLMALPIEGGSNTPVEQPPDMVGDLVVDDPLVQERSRAGR